MHFEFSLEVDWIRERAIEKFWHFWTVPKYNPDVLNQVIKSKWCILVDVYWIFRQRRKINCLRTRTFLHFATSDQNWVIILISVILSYAVRYSLETLRVETVRFAPKIKVELNFQINETNGLRFRSAFFRFRWRRMEEVGNTKKVLTVLYCTNI